MQFKTRLKRVIARHNMTASYVAIHLGTSQAHVSKWCQQNEDGTAKSLPSAEYIIKLELLFNTSAIELFPPVIPEPFPLTTNEKKAKPNLYNVSMF